MKEGQKYSIKIKRSAEKSMDKLPSGMFERVATAILALETDPRPHRVKKLSGSQSFRLRIGDYRVLYTVDDAARTVLVMAVGTRGHIYREH